ncbi:MAG: hypothetical protein HY832_03140 [Candidatus Aenigmarchaeota archaeon]|nr:hypothetical protein [Candidatus Aenigmarchaeota archaeon]
MDILLDTNMLLLPASLHIDVYDQLRGHTIFTLDACTAELEKLAQRKGKEGKNAVLAQNILVAHKLLIEHTEEHAADTAIVAFATKHRCAVGTNDKRLTKALKEQGLPVFWVKQKKYIVEI